MRLIANRKALLTDCFSRRHCSEVTYKCFYIDKRHCWRVDVLYHWSSRRETCFLLSSNWFFSFSLFLSLSLVDESWTSFSFQTLRSCIGRFPMSHQWRISISNIRNSSKCRQNMRETYVELPLNRLDLAVRHSNLDQERSWGCQRHSAHTSPPLYTTSSTEAGWIALTSFFVSISFDVSRCVNMSWLWSIKRINACEKECRKVVRQLIVTIAMFFTGEMEDHSQLLYSVLFRR